MNAIFISILIIWVLIAICNIAILEFNNYIDNYKPSYSERVYMNYLSILMSPIIFIIIIICYIEYLKNNKKKGDKNE